MRAFYFDENNSPVGKLNNEIDFFVSLPEMGDGITLGRPGLLFAQFSDDECL